MKTINWGALLTAAAPLLLAGPAVGADLSPAAPLAAPAAAPFSWTGWYIGANAGYAVNQGYGRYRGGTLEAFNAATAGGFGGVHLGYNYQILGNFVIGAETDFQGGGISDSRTCLGGCAPGAQIDHKLDWFGTTRARIGMANGPVLSYVTAGAAYGGTQTGVSTPAGSVSDSATKLGWTWGGGIEVALDGNWSARAEYLYVDLGATDAASPAAGALTVKTQEQIFRGGISYRFGPSQPPAPQTPVNWAGLYAGGTFGAGIGHNDSTLTGPAGSGAGAEAFDLSPRGFDGGGSAGYDWQFGNWVAGVVGDFEASTGRGYLTVLADGSAVDQKLQWFATARGRVGYSVGQALFYATGGAAFGDVKNSITQAGTAASFTHGRSGFTAGAGIESRLKFFNLLGDNWTTRTEYLFVDLGTVRDTVAPLNEAQPRTLASAVREHIWRTVVSYRF